MSLADGTKLGPYEIVEQIGAGGMGEVYRARDTRLDRDVAIKVLPAALAEHPDRLARFEREAKVLAALKHPNIAVIYGLEDRAIVMELIEGPTLADRLKAGPLPLEETLAIAQQIIAALEAAHDKGVVHRDLKPANVKAPEDGTVKVLDFGLAVAVQVSAEEPGDPKNSPTLTLGATQVGAILGTADYMAPEQAAGRKVDRRADIWSFGVVLWEMLTGERLFHGGEDVAHTLADVLRAEIDFGKLPPTTPATVVELLKRCLDRDPKTRLRDIGEARVTIQRVGQGHALPIPGVTGPQHWLWPSLAAGLAVVSGVALWGWLRPRLAEPHRVVRFANSISVANGANPIALSRDGTLLAFVGGPQRQIYVRRMDEFEARPLQGTDESAALCFSPDGEWISYISGRRDRGNQLRKIAVAGGAPQMIASVASALGPPVQNWAQDNNIIFSGDEGLMRVPATGGKPEKIASPDSSTGERVYTSPQMLPDRRHVLFSILLVNRGSDAHRIAVLNLETSEKKIVLDGAGVAQYAPTEPGSSLGHIVYWAPATGSLTAVSFDANRLAARGSPVSIVDGVRNAVGGIGAFGISESGTLAFVPGAPREGNRSTLVWVDRQGGEQPVPTPPRYYRSPRLSPDGDRAAIEVQEGTAGKRDIWVADLVRGSLSRITSESINASPVWTPDGKHLIYLSGPTPDRGALLSAPADGSGPPSVLASGAEVFAPDSVSPDGKLVIGRRITRPVQGVSGPVADVAVLSLAEGSPADAKPQVVLNSQSRVANIQFSPDGRWVAYVSDESGSEEIYLRAYPGPGGKTTISTDGGTGPRWGRNGELFYRNGEKMMAVELQTTPLFRAGKPKVLFEHRYGDGYDVTRDGKRFLMFKFQTDSQPPPDRLNIVMNWFEELRRRSPAGGK